MPLRNTKTRDVICDRVRLLTTSAERARGYMFTRRQHASDALVFDLGSTSRAGGAIHMLFCFFEIDAFFLDAEKNVVDLVRGLRPFSLGHYPRASCRFIVEIPSDMNPKIELGDRLEWTLD